jgi:hypothetical protein
MGLEVKDWAMKWVEGSIISCIQGQNASKHDCWKNQESLEQLWLENRRNFSLDRCCRKQPRLFVTLSKAGKSVKLRSIGEAVAEMDAGRG